MSRPIRVIDKRNKHYFMVDDIYLNGYARHLGPITSMVYISLCRHVDRDQNAFPSQDQIAKEIRAGVRSVKDAIAQLKEWNLIDIERERTEHRWARNSYYLLDKSVWKKPSRASGARDKSSRSGATDSKDQGHVVHTKDTHIKDTHKDILHISSKRRYGNGDVNEILDYLKQALGLPDLDGSEKTNRQYAWLLIRKSKTGVDGVRWLIDQAAGDGWWRNHITSVRDLWNNKIKIVSSKRSEVKVYNVEN